MEAISGVFAAVAHGLVAAAAAVGEGISSLARRGAAGARSGARRKGVPCCPQLLRSCRFVHMPRLECDTFELVYRHTRHVALVASASMLLLSSVECQKDCCQAMMWRC